MGKSSIAKQLRAGAGSVAALELGRRVRERRLEIGMTQSELATPLSRGFVSAVEQGQALPSLWSLWLFAARLGVGVGNLVDGVDASDGIPGLIDVNGADTTEYTPAHDQRTARGPDIRRSTDIDQGADIDQGPDIDRLSDIGHPANRDHRPTTPARRR